MQMPEATFDYNLATGTPTLLQQHRPVLHQPSGAQEDSRNCVKETESDAEWIDLSSRYVCEQVTATSADGVHVPLTIVHSKNLVKDGCSPALLIGYGAYGQMLETEWCSDRLSLLDRGWVLAFSHVRYVGARSTSVHISLRPR